uniref:Uncharacterized protein n=2 Tax=Homalodisca TaxID=139475 RepID=A0A1B6JIY9_9HEMI
MSPGPTSPTPGQPAKVSGKRASGSSPRSSGGVPQEETSPAPASPPSSTLAPASPPPPAPTPTPAPPTEQPKLTSPRPPSPPPTQEKRASPILCPVNTQPPQVGGGAGAAASTPVVVRAEEPPSAPPLVNGHQAAQVESEPQVLVSHVLTNPGPEYWRQRNPVADEIFITDVTVNLSTVTIRECKTEKGFFRERSGSQSFDC